MIPSSCTWPRRSAHVATSVGARGREAVRSFYAEYLIGNQASDMRLALPSRTATSESVVDELVTSFTHDVEIPWVLPGVAPTGRAVVVPIVTVIGMRDGLVGTEHIYWDQASVLAQVGLLEATALPVTGADQVRPQSIDASPDVFNRLLAKAMPGGR